MKLSFACFGNANTLAHVSCEYGTKVAVHKILFGVKDSPRCPYEATESTPLGCCVPLCGECLVENDSRSQTIMAATPCAGRQECAPRADRVAVTNCGNRVFTNYMVVMYECISGSFTGHEARGRITPQTGNMTNDEIICMSTPLLSKMTTHQDIFPDTTNTGLSVSGDSKASPGVGTNIRPDAYQAEAVTLHSILLAGLVGGIFIILLLTAVILAVIFYRRGKKPKPANAAISNRNISRGLDTLKPDFHRFSTIRHNNLNLPPFFPKESHTSLCRSTCSVQSDYETLRTLSVTQQPYSAYSMQFFGARSLRSLPSSQLGKSTSTLTGISSLYGTWKEATESIPDLKSLSNAWGQASCLEFEQQRDIMRRYKVGDMSSFANMSYADTRSGREAATVQATNEWWDNNIATLILNNADDVPNTNKDNELDNFWPNNESIYA